jgi:putative membrane protein
MKRINLFLMAACAAWMLQGCSNGAKTNSTSSADSANAAKMSDTTASGATTTAADPVDAKFAVDAANGGMAEVALGNLAKQQATNAKVKDFADMMVTDHTKANNELMALAKTKNITLPDSVSNDKKAAMTDLSKKTGADFDKAYVDMMIDGHQKTINLFEDESKNGKDADIKAFADKTLPTIKMHLSHIQAIHDAMK